MGWQDAPLAASEAKSSWQNAPLAAAASEGAKAGAAAFRSTVNPSKNFVSPNEALGSNFENFMAGVGRGASQPAVGAGQRIAELSGQGAQATADVEAQQQADTPLMATKAGFFGNEVGSTIANLPANLLKPIGGGAVAGFLTPTAHDESVAANTAVSAVLSKGIAEGATALHGAVNATANNKAIQAAASNVKNQAIAVAQRLGFKLNPVEANPGNSFANKAVGFGGEAKLTTANIVENQPKTNAAAITDFKLPPDTQPSHDVMDQVRKKAMLTQYAPLSNELGNIDLSGQFGAQLYGMVQTVGSASKQLGVESAVYKPLSDDIEKAVTTVLSKGDGTPITQIKASTLVDMIGAQRTAARDLFKQANNPGAGSQPMAKQLAGAHLAIADTLENFIESVAQQHADFAKTVLGDPAAAAKYAKVVSDWQAGRRIIAKTLTMDRVLEPNGDVNALKLARLQNAPNSANRVPLDGGMKIVADLAAQFPRDFAPAARRAGKADVNMTDTAMAIGAAISAAAKTASSTGSPAAAAAAGATAAVGGGKLRSAVRAYIQSPRFQQNNLMPPTPGIVPNTLTPTVRALTNPALQNAPSGLSMFNVQQPQ